jgi:REP element-mobilizing transposase RayT
LVTHWPGKLQLTHPWRFRKLELAGPWRYQAELGNEDERRGTKMRSRYKVLEQAAPHFITSTVVEWLPVFTSSAHCDLLIESLKFCREQKGLQLYAFVIMDNHIHLLAYADNLPRLMKEFKSYTASRLIHFLESSGNQRLLKDLFFSSNEARQSAATSSGRRGIIRKR